MYRCQGWEENSTYTDDSSVTLDVTRKCRLVSHMVKGHITTSKSMLLPKGMLEISQMC